MRRNPARQTRPRVCRAGLGPAEGEADEARDATRVKRVSLLTRGIMRESCALYLSFQTGAVSCIHDHPLPGETPASLKSFGMDTVVKHVHRSEAQRSREQRQSSSDQVIAIAKAAAATRYHGMLAAIGNVGVLLPQISAISCACEAMNLPYVVVCAVFSRLTTRQACGSLLDMPGVGVCLWLGIRGEIRDHSFKQKSARRFLDQSICCKLDKSAGREQS